MTADGGDGEQQFLPVISGRASAKLNRIAAKMTRPPKQKARPSAKLPRSRRAFVRGRPSIHNH